jgi:hypothetical protein
MAKKISGQDAQVAAELIEGLRRFHAPLGAHVPAPTKNGLDGLHNRIEAVIATAIVEAALAKGWAITVNDGEEDAFKRGTHRQQVLDAMSSTDDDRLTFFDMGNGGARVGSVWLIYGNDQDVVSDWTDAEGRRRRSDRRFPSPDLQPVWTLKMTNNRTARRLYFVAGKVAQSGAEYSVWGAHLWADSAADARAIAADMTARDQGDRGKRRHDAARRWTSLRREAEQEQSRQRHEFLLGRRHDQQSNPERHHGR